MPSELSHQSQSQAKITLQSQLMIDALSKNLTEEQMLAVGYFASTSYALERGIEPAQTRAEELRKLSFDEPAKSCLRMSQSGFEAFFHHEDFWQKPDRPDQWLKEFFESRLSALSNVMDSVDGAHQNNDAAKMARIYTDIAATTLGGKELNIKALAGSPNESLMDTLKKLEAIDVRAAMVAALEGVKPNTVASFLRNSGFSVTQARSEFLAQGARCIAGFSFIDRPEFSYNDYPEVTSQGRYGFAHAIARVAKKLEEALNRGAPETEIKERSKLLIGTLFSAEKAFDNLDKGVPVLREREAVDIREHAIKALSTLVEKKSLCPAPVGDLIETSVLPKLIETAKRLSPTPILSMENCVPALPERNRGLSLG